jgi:hypothetical protein
MVGPCKGPLEPRPWGAAPMLLVQVGSSEKSAVMSTCVCVQVCTCVCVCVRTGVYLCVCICCACVHVRVHLRRGGGAYVSIVCVWSE